MAVSSLDNNPGKLAPEATAAVAALGLAVHDSHTVLSALNPNELDLAQRLARDANGLGAVPRLRAAYDEAMQRREAALDAIWPRSSSNRPRTNKDVFEACTSIAALALAPEARFAQALSVLQGEDSSRLSAEARHVAELDDRLRALGVDGDEPSDNPLWQAADGLDRLVEGYGIRTLEEAESCLASMSQGAKRLRTAADSTALIVAMTGLRRATASQILTLARHLARAPSPWTTIAHPEADLTPIRAKLEAAAARAAKISDNYAKIDRQFGTAWHGEDSGKIAAAAQILSDPNDLRLASATSYAASIGVQGPREAVVLALQGMAKTAKAGKTPLLDAQLVSLFSPLWEDGVTDPRKALDYLDLVREWRNQGLRSETLQHAVLSIAGLRSGERDNILGRMQELAGILETLDEKDARVSPETLAQNAEALEAGIRQITDHLRSFPEPVLQEARRIARLLRERRQASHRMASDPAFRRTGLATPTDLVSGYLWSVALSKHLPVGLDPRIPGIAATVGEAARQALEAAQNLLAIDEGIVKVAGMSDLEMLERAHHGAVTIVRREKARILVATSDAFDLVARLEEEGIEPELWGEAAEGLRTMPPSPPTHEEDIDMTPALPRVETFLPQPAGIPAFPFADKSAWEWRSLPSRG